MPTNTTVTAVLLAVVSAALFLALAHAAVNTPREPFRALTAILAVVSLMVLVVAPFAGAALLAPVLLSRRLANAPVPSTVDELLGRRPRD